MAVDDIKAHEKGDAEAGFFHREALDGAHLLSAPEIEQVSDPSCSNPFVQVAKLAGAGDYAR